MSEIVVRQTVKLTDNITIELDGNASTGFMWQFEFDILKLSKILEEYMVDARWVAGSEKVKVIFKPISVGETTVYAKYRRPWEDNPPLQEINYQITVID